MFRFGRNDGTDQLVCAAQVRELARRVQAREALAAKNASNPKRQRALQEARAALEGERAKCLLEQRMQRKEMTYASRATRMGSKAEILRQKQEMEQARLATKMQRLEYRKAKTESGVGDGKAKAVGFLAVAAAGAAFFLL